MKALVKFNSWAGLTRHKVTVLRETPKRYVVRWDDTNAFMGKFQNGYEYYIPKRALTYKEWEAHKNYDEEEQIQSAWITGYLDCLA